MKAIDDSYKPLDLLLNKRVIACSTDNIYCDHAIDQGDFVICDRSDDQPCIDLLYHMV